MYFIHEVGRIVFWILAAIAVYELLLRAFLLGKLRAWLHRRSQRYAEQHNVRVDLFKYGSRLLIKEELLNDPVVNEAMREAVRGGAVWKAGQQPRPPRPPEEVRREVEGYIDEIVPAFSLAAYYQFGMALAKAAILAVYRPVIDRASQERLRAVPKDATAVYLINHRSNFDYVVVGWALARQVALSYAVGEWARVFPLDALFKAFGGFFVRRGFPDPLYHQVLRRYLQLITRRGVTQGIFPEGGLTRDGKLRPPKVGLLDALLQLTCEPGFSRELIFVPVGINYDRVLEDRHLLAEARGQKQAPTLSEKVLGTFWLIVLAPVRALLGLFRALTGKLQTGGYVAVAFGEPLRFSDWSKKRGIDLKSMSDEERRGAAKLVAAELMREIAQVIPATPVPLVARAMLELSGVNPSQPQNPSAANAANATTPAASSALAAAPAGPPIGRDALNAKVRELRAALEARGVPIALGEEFAGTQAEQAAMAEHKNRDLSRFTGEMISSDEAESIAQLGLDQLTRRSLLVTRGAEIALPAEPSAREVLAYYARSLESPP